MILTNGIMKVIIRFAQNKRTIMLHMRY